MMRNCRFCSVCVDMLLVVLKTSTLTILSAMKKRKWYEIKKLSRLSTQNILSRSRCKLLTDLYQSNIGHSSSSSNVIINTIVWPL